MEAAVYYHEGEVPSRLVPGPVEYALLAPADPATLKKVPLVLSLHGGGGSRDVLKRQRRQFEKLWHDEAIPAAIVVTPSVAERSFYMNYRDGSERWEDFILQEFLPWLREKWPVDPRSERTLVMGVSMGGMGALRMAFHQPDMFGAVAALEPGIEPVLRWQDVREKHRFWKEDDLFHRAFGEPVDAGYWALNNPATLARTNAADIRKSGIQIYLEAGDLDQFWLYEGAEFLHRMLWEQKIRHEYHLVRGADHVGPSLGERTDEAIRFLFRSYRPWGDPPLRLKPVLLWLEMKKRRLDEKDHYHE